MTAEKPTHFLHQISNAKPEEAIDILKKVTEHPSIFVFGEFLEEAAVKQLAGGSQAKYLDMLHLFCFGSYTDYCHEKGRFPELSPAQISKLKQLTIIDEAHSHRQISYKCLMEKLSISSLRELEDIIIDLMYLEAITGKLDQQKALLDVDSAIGRDVKDGEWCGRVDSVLDHMANEIRLANSRRQDVDAYHDKIANDASELKFAIKGQMKKAQSDASHMDVDEYFGMPELMTDGNALAGRSPTTMRSANSTNTSTGSPSGSADPSVACGGEKDPRNKKAVFRGLRHTKMFK